MNRFVTRERPSTLNDNLVLGGHLVCPSPRSSVTSRDSSPPTLNRTHTPETPRPPKTKSVSEGREGWDPKGHGEDLSSITSINPVPPYWRVVMRLNSTQRSSDLSPTPRHRVLPEPSEKRGTSRRPEERRSGRWDVDLRVERVESSCVVLRRSLLVVDVLRFALDRPADLLHAPVDVHWSPADLRRSPAHRTVHLLFDSVHRR